MDTSVLKAIEYFCGKLTHNQKVMIDSCDGEKRILLGIGRPLGQRGFCPMLMCVSYYVVPGRRTETIEVVNGAGHWDLCAVEGRRSIENVIKTFGHEVGGY